MSRSGSSWYSQGTKPSAPRAVLEISGFGGVPVIPARYTRSNPAQSAVRNSAQTLWSERRSQRRSEVFKGNDEEGLKTEPQGFKNFSDVFGNLLGHRGFDDDEEVSCPSVENPPLSFDSEFGSRLGVGRNFQRKLLFRIRNFDRNFAAKQEIQKRNRRADRYVRGSARCRTEDIGEIERLEIRAPGTSGSSRKIPEQIFEPRCRKTRSTSKSLVARGSKRIVILAFLRIRKDFVGGRYFFELGFARLVSRIFVGMVFHGEFPIGLLDLVFGSRARNSKDIVGIFIHGETVAERKAGRYFWDGR